VRRLGLVAAVSVLAAGCGGHDSRTPYAKQLDELCKRAGSRIAKIPRPETPTELIRSKREVNAIGTSFVRDVTALPASRPERARAARMAGFYDAYWRAQPGLLRLIRAQQYDVYGRFEETASRYEKQAEAIAVQLGAKECEKNPVR
jgi:hypothetical protein